MSEQMRISAKARWARAREAKTVTPQAQRAAQRENLSLAVSKARNPGNPGFPLQAPVLPPGVIPRGVRAAVAMDSDIPGIADSYAYLLSNSMGNSGFVGFPGYQYLAMLSTRAEYRAIAAALSTELTREWIELNSTEAADDNDVKDKITKILAEFSRLHVQQTCQTMLFNDAIYGRGQLFIDIKNQDRSLPLVMDKRTIALGSLEAVRNVEALWTSPMSYNALDPAASDFYRPTKWFMLGQLVDSTRLLTVVTRPLPDLLKPAFNFSGMSLSQLAEPYINNWLRTRQSIADLVNNFSIISLSTSMDQVLQGNDDGTNLFKRAELFTLTRQNKGVFLLDKDREVLEQLAVPLGGLAELQSQSCEQISIVSHIPKVIWTGEGSNGLNASGESTGELAMWYDWIHALQEAHLRQPLETILKIVQLSLFGEIDENIILDFKPLLQLSEKELAEVRTANGNTDAAYIDRGVLDPSEVREKLARDPESGYNNLRLDLDIEPPEDNDEIDETETETDPGKGDKSERGAKDKVQSAA